MLKRIFIGVVVLVGIAVAGAFLLPRNVHVRRSIEIAAPAEVIFPLINSPRQFNEWSPWARLDPNIKTTYSGPESGVGAKMEWQSDDKNVGSGTSEITASRTNKMVRTSMDFGDMGAAEAFFIIQKPKDDKTTVIWGFNTDLGMNPIARYMGLMFDGWIGKDYETGLANLKQLAEKPAE